MIVPIVRTVPIVPILTIVTNVDAESGFDAISLTQRCLDQSHELLTVLK